MGTSRPQQYRISWPLTPQGVEDIDTMFETLFKVLRGSTASATSASLETTGGELTLGSVIGQLDVARQDGDDGEIGYPGVMGPIGPQGIRGLIGPYGDVGEDGADGIPGSVGAAGSVGPQGPAGIGTPGNDGDDGIDGTPGVSGAPGVTGATGPQGATGMGVPGSDGEDGDTWPHGMNSVPSTGTGLAVFADSPTLTTSPTAPTQTATDSSTKIATTAFVSTAIANAIAGVNPAIAVAVASAAILTNTPTYNNGVSGIGAFITTVTTNTALVVDGYTPILGDRVLVKNEGDTSGLGAAKNGVYTVTQLAAIGLAWILTRALDYDTSSDINNTGSIPVENHGTNALTSWLLTTLVTTVGTDSLLYIQFSYTPSDLARLSVQNTFSNTSGQIIRGPLDLTGASAGQIIFPATQNPSSNANTLDDYEEGSWTPIFTGTGGGTTTYTTQVGIYTKTGNLVSIGCYILCVNAGSLSGMIGISGLPFTSKSGAYQWALAPGYFGGLNSTIYFIGAYMDPNGTRVQMTKLAAAATDMGFIVAADLAATLFFLGGSYQTS